MLRQVRLAFLAGLAVVVLLIPVNRWRPSPETLNTEPVRQVGKVALRELKAPFQHASISCLGYGRLSIAITRYHHT